MILGKWFAVPGLEKRSLNINDYLDSQKKYETLLSDERM